MQENEFEKRLQEEMEEFRLRPSEVVWDKIDDQLRKKKRRRIVFYIFLLAGLSLIGYSGYLLFTEKQNLTEQDVAINDKPTNNDTQKSIPGDQTIATQKSAKDQDQIIMPGENKTEASREKQIIEKRYRLERPGELQKTEPARQNELKASENNIAAGEKITTPPNDQDNKPVVGPGPVPTDELAGKNINTDEELTSEKKDINSPKSDSAIAAIEKQGQILPVDQQKQKKKSTLPIKWGLDLSVGVSQLSSKAFSFSAVSQNADALYAAPGNLNSSPPPSDVLNGIAFKVGIVGELNVSKKSSVSAGLGYAYYSNRIKTGSYKDSSLVLRTMTAQSVALNSYYQGSQVMEYTNHYHFIQLPVNYQLQLNKGVKLPLIWSIGIAPAYLFSTDALIYDTARGGIHYKNNDAFNKFHFNINTGLSFRFGKTNKMQWSLGPELSMDMTGLMKDADQKRYFMYGGITGRVYFKKKNIK